MNLLVINPNTSHSITEGIRKTVERVRSPDTSVTVTEPDFGPEALESFYDYTLSAFGLCRLLEREKEGRDGILVACFGDPGLYAAKEICPCPVIGIAEASIAMSLLLGSRFSILAASEKAVPMMEDMVARYGMDRRLAGVFPLNMGVLEAESSPQKTVERLIEQGRLAISKGAEVLILGCAGMTGFSEPVSKALNIPVLDPVKTAFLALEALCGGGFEVSRKGLYQAPAKQNIMHEGLLTHTIQ